MNHQPNCSVNNKIGVMDILLGRVVTCTCTKEKQLEYHKQFCGRCCACATLFPEKLAEGHSDSCAAYAKDNIQYGCTCSKGGGYGAIISKPEAKEEKGYSREEYLLKKFSPEAKKECYCNDDRAKGKFSNGHFENCPQYDSTEPAGWEVIGESSEEYTIRKLGGRGEFDDWTRVPKSFIAREVEKERQRILKEVKGLEIHNYSPTRGRLTYDSEKDRKLMDLLEAAEQGTDIEHNIIAAHNQALADIKKIINET